MVKKPERPSKGTSKKGDHKKPKQPTEYQRERAKAKDRKKKNGNYGVGL